MRVYFARPISQYGTPQDDRDMALLSQLGFELINPAEPSLESRYKKKEGMAFFIELAKSCDLIVFRAFIDGKISAGVWKEITETGKPVMELPNLMHRELSVEQTRTYLQLLGAR